MSSSDLSELSSSLSSHEDSTPVSVSRGKLEHYFKHGSSAAPKSPPVKKKRPPSPPHEYVLADNPDIAVSSIRYVLMRARIARVRFNKNSADPSRRAVHLHVPFALQRGFPKDVSPLWTSRYRTWCGRHNTGRPNRKTTMCSARPGPQSKERHRVRLIWLHLDPLIQTPKIKELVIIYGLLANPSPV